jgi:hypothetical protein
MDARGLQTLGLTAADSTADMTSQQVEESLTNRRNDFFESQSGLNYLAQQTGGFSIRNTNDLNSGIKRVIEDQSGYYLIGYRPDLSTFDRINGRGKFHKISLKVKRPGKFNVRVRNGFFGISDDQITAIKQTPNQQMISALTSPFGFADVHLRLTSLFGNDPKLGSIMRSYLHVSGHDLTFTDEPDGWHKAVFDLMAVTFGDNGIVVDQLNRIHTMRVRGATYERIRDSGFIYNLAVPAKKPGAYQLRTALRDEGSSRVGSATQFIEVPDIKKNRLTVSGIFLKGTPLNVYIKSLEKASSAQGADDTAEDADPKANTAVRQFRRGMAMEYGLNVYNAQIDKATSKPLVKTQVRIFRDGKLIFSGNEIPLDLVNQPDLKRLAIFGAIQLGTSMLPGEYIFQVVVTDTLAKEKRRMVTQWMDFEITD